MTKTTIITLITIALAFTAETKTVKPKTDREIKELIVEQSVGEYLAYVGNCPCPYNRTKANRRCGERSAYSKPGGQEPLCYVSDVTDDMVKAWKLEIN